MRFAEIPRTVTTLWAKSDEGEGHSLLVHMLDVAAVCQVLLQREPEAVHQWLAEQLDLPPGDAVRFVAAVAGLHDIGKATPGFEQKWLRGKDVLASLGFDFPRETETQHGVSTQKILAGVLKPCMTQELANTLREVLGAHHGVFISPNTLGNAFLGGNKQWKEAQTALFEAYWKALSPMKPGRDKRLAFPVTAWLAGLVSVADWIGSSESFCPHAGSPNMGQRADTLEEHFAKSCLLAEHVLTHVVGWPTAAPLLDKDIPLNVLLSAIVGGQGLEARPLQKAGTELLGHPTQPVLLLVEAPMGEGKTELAFLAHLQLQKCVGHRGMYVALPTQATGNAMFKRSITFLESLRPTTHLDIQLAHGGAQANTDALRLREAYGAQEEAVASSAWFTQRRRPLLSPYGVGTVDQALFSILNVKHHFVRVFGLGHKVVILDEVHAYDVYTSGLIVALIRWLKAVGSSVVLMSATLPASRRRELLEAWGATCEQQTQELTYPRVLLAQGGTVRGQSFEARPQAAIALAHLPESTAALADKAAQLVRTGGCGAVVVNTVQRAQDLFCTPQSHG